MLGVYLQSEYLSPLLTCCRSVALLLQVSLPCALFAGGPSELCLKGGTNAEMAPQIDYTMKVEVYWLLWAAEMVSQGFMW